MKRRAGNAAKETTVYTLFPALQRAGARNSIIHTPEQNGAVHHRRRAMNPSTGPHANGLISVPLRDSLVSSAIEQRLTIQKPQPASRKTGKAAVRAVMTEPILIKISAVLIEEGDCWSAQCLEYDVAA